MSFWGLSDGQTAADTPKEFEVGGGNMEVIPANSDVMAMVSNAKWIKKGQEGSERDLIELEWTVVAPEAVKNRKVFHKLWVSDFDPSAEAKSTDKAKAKRDKARRMLAAIDANAGGNLTKSGEAPTDQSLMMHLSNKPMVIKVMTWNLTGSDGNPMEGNWVAAVSPSDKELHLAPAAPKAVASGGGGYGGGNADVGEEIPF